eukprot:jgi/Botrbrau1/8073/Bobra.13_2s0039.1
MDSGLCSASVFDFRRGEYLHEFPPREHMNNGQSREVAHLDQRITEFSQPPSTSPHEPVRQTARTESVGNSTCCKLTLQLREALRRHVAYRAAAVIALESSRDPVRVPRKHERSPFHRVSKGAASPFLESPKGGPKGLQTEALSPKYLQVRDGGGTMCGEIPIEYSPAEWWNGRDWPPYTSPFYIGEYATDEAGNVSDPSAGLPWQPMSSIHKSSVRRDTSPPFYPASSRKKIKVVRRTGSNATFTSSPTSTTIPGDVRAATWEDIDAAVTAQP